MADDGAGGLLMEDGIGAVLTLFFGILLIKGWFVLVDIGTVGLRGAE